MLSKAFSLLFASCLTLLCALPVSAAEGYAIQCTNKKCGYHETLLLGPGMLGERITGYCRRCKKFVTISWKRDGEPPAPVAAKTVIPVGERQTYACPACAKPFTEIREPEDIKQCPRCKSKTTGWEQPVMTAD